MRYGMQTIVSVLCGDLGDQAREVYDQGTPVEGAPPGTRVTFLDPGTAYYVERSGCLLGVADLQSTADRDENLALLAALHARHPLDQAG